MIASEQAEAFEIIGGTHNALLILCDHAQASIPPELGNLGLCAQQLSRHIAYDIGAEAVSRHLAGKLGCPAVLSRFSRLLIDPNRGLDDPTLVMRIADGALIPGNARIDQAGINARIARFYRPYDDAIARTIATMRRSGKNPAILAIHSFTPEMKGIARPWHATIIWDFDPRFNLALLKALESEPDLIVGENEPYQGGYGGDTMDRHAIRTGIAHALLEIRQNEITTPEQQEAWAERLARLLPPLLQDEQFYEARIYGVHE